MIPFIGFCLGVGVSALGLFGWALLIKVLAKSAETGIAPRKANFFIILVFIIKLPVFVLAARQVFLLGHHAPACFLVGMSVVYCLFVGWAQARR